jgi:signal transduction histidine kinase
MRWPWPAASIRLRLTAWYAVVLTLMLVVYAGATYLAVRHEFLEQLEEQRHHEVEGSLLEEVDRLSNLVDTLLRLSYGDAGAVRLERTPCDFGQLARDVVSSLSVLAEERNQQLRLDVVDGVTVGADRFVLREAITNVVDNAIKYGGRGSTIEVRVRPDRGEAVLTVADQGPGVAPEHRERIFDRFVRLDEARSRDSGGAGLGLAIARWAVDVNGGRISVDGGAHGGSVFRIALPVWTPEPGKGVAI